LVDGLFDDVQKDSAKVIEALFGAILLVAKVNVSNVHEAHR
jgi:hypothetical protein